MGAPVISIFVHSSSPLPKLHKRWTSPATILFSRRRHARSSEGINIEAKFKAKDLYKVDKNVLQDNLKTAMQKSENIFKNYSYNLDINQEQIASCKSLVFIAYLTLCLYLSFAPSLETFSDKVICFFCFLWCFVFSSRAPIFILLFSV